MAYSCRLGLGFVRQIQLQAEKLFVHLQLFFFQLIAVFFSQVKVEVKYDKLNHTCHEHCHGDTDNASDGKGVVGGEICRESGHHNRNNQCHHTEQIHLSPQIVQVVPEKSTKLPGHKAQYDPEDHQAYENIRPHTALKPQA